MRNRKQSLYAGRSKAFLSIFILMLSVLLFNDSTNLYGLLTMVGIYSIVTLGLSLLMGYAGQVSLGHAAFFGIGAYTSGILTTTHGVNPFLAMLCGVAITFVIALIVGIPALKLQGFSLALATIGFNQIIYIVIISQSRLTGGASGFSGIPGLALFGLDLSENRYYFLLVWLLVLLIAYVSLNIIDSHVGRVLRGIHDSEIATLTFGVNISAFKVQIFVLSAIYASIAGSLYAHFINFIAPPTFSVVASIQFLVMVAVGGSQSVWGAILGAFAMTFIGEGVRTIVPLLMDGGGQVEVVVYGVVLVLVMMFMPKGLIHSLKNVRDRSGFSRRSALLAKEEERRSG